MTTHVHVITFFGATRALTDPTGALVVVIFEPLSAVSIVGSALGIGFPSLWCSFSV